MSHRELLDNYDRDSEDSDTGYMAKTGHFDQDMSQWVTECVAQSKAASYDMIKTVEHRLQLTMEERFANLETLIRQNTANANQTQTNCFPSTHNLPLFVVNPRSSLCDVVVSKMLPAPVYMLICGGNSTAQYSLYLNACGDINSTISVQPTRTRMCIKRCLIFYEGTLYTCISIPIRVYLINYHYRMLTCSCCANVVLSARTCNIDPVILYFTLIETLLDGNSTVSDVLIYSISLSNTAVAAPLLALI